MTDAAGVSHEPAGAESRIVSLVPSITELLFDLGLGLQTVARTQYCIQPTEAVGRIPTVGGTKRANLRKLRALNPTHVILNMEENTREMAADLRTFVPHLVVTYPQLPVDNERLYRMLGGIFGREAEANRLCAEFKESLRYARERTKALPVRRVLYLIWKDPWMTVSWDTYIARMLWLGNLKHVDAGGARYPEIGDMPALLGQADIVLFSSEPHAFTMDDVEEFRRQFDCTGKTLALVDGTMISWYGSRAIRGLRYLGDLAPTLHA
jgi:ABC-type Fe3+-hydroxamate transport system substrate-binding protein